MITSSRQGRADAGRPLEGGRHIGQRADGRQGQAPRRGGGEGFDEIVDGVA